MTTAALPARSKRQCTVGGCNDKHDAKGYCHRHYQRFLATGNPLVKPSRDVDELAVEQAVRGNLAGSLTVAEREAAVRQLCETDLRFQEIADRLGLAGVSSVYAIRKRIGLTPGGDQS